jgi:magnesium transporter
MNSEIVNFIFLSEILGLPVIDGSSGKKIGILFDLTALTNQVFPKISGVIIKNSTSNNNRHIPWGCVRTIMRGRSIIVDNIPALNEGMQIADESEILLKTTFLDKQIISISGNKVVRVNDLHLLIDNTTKENPNLWLAHIDIGIKGLFRRLGWVQMVNAVFYWVTSRDIKDKFVSWKHVQPTATTNVYGSVHLKIDSSKLSEIHPADIADILEALGNDERISLIESLKPEIAADTLQETQLKIRVQIAEAIDPTKLSVIVNELPTDEAVDLLDEISTEQRNAVFVNLQHEKAQELKELSKLSIYGVGSIMTTDFISVKKTESIKNIIALIKDESVKTELIYYVYIIDEVERLIGVVTLRRLLVTDLNVLVGDIMTEQVVSVEINTSIKRVAKIFYKYNFAAIPVVDGDGCMHGVISFRDALEAVFPEMKEGAD